VRKPLSEAATERSALPCDTPNASRWSILAVARPSKLHDPYGKDAGGSGGQAMTEPVRWYEAVYNGDDRQAFFDDLVAIFRKDHRDLPPETYGANRPRLDALIQARGGRLDGRPTWVRIVSEMIDMDTVEVKQRQPDGTDSFFMLTAEETQSLVRS
jgi:hypothetical protein